MASTRRAGDDANVRPIGHWIMLASLYFTSGAFAEVEFDGSIGPNANGTLRSGAIEIGESDGQLAGTNLFHSFSRFNVLSDELVTFTHTSLELDNIIARVSGITPSLINGAVATRFLNGADVSPSSAVLWLLNPNGILLGDGASFDVSSVYLSTANRLGFDNGESIFSHDIDLSSTLSVANPVEFGFLDQQALPQNLVPGGISLQFLDSGNFNPQVFLSNIHLIGTSVDPADPGVVITGDLLGSFVDNAGAIANSSQLVSSGMEIIALSTHPGDGSSVELFSNQADRLSGTLGTVEINNANLTAVSNPLESVTTVSIDAANILVNNSVLDGLTTPNEVSFRLRAEDAAVFTDSILRTSTSGANPAGSIFIDASGLALDNTLLSSEAVQLMTASELGNTGNIVIGSSESLPLTTFLARESQLLTTSSGLSDAGDIIVNAVQDINLLGSSPDSRTLVGTLSGGGGNSGDVIFLADRIVGEFTSVLSTGANENIDTPLIGLIAENGDLLLDRSTLFSAATDGASADIVLQASENIVLTSVGETNSIQSISNGDLNAGSITVAAGSDLMIAGSFQVNSGRLENVQDLAQAGEIFLSGQNVMLDASEAIVTEDQARGIVIDSSTVGAGAGADIRIATTSDTGSVAILGPVSITSTARGAGDAGNVRIVGHSISSATAGNVPGANLSTLTTGSGSAGMLQILASEELTLDQAIISSLSAADGSAGSIDLGARFVNLTDSLLNTSTQSSNSLDTPASLRINSLDELVVTRSTVEGSSLAQAPGAELFFTSTGLIEITDTTVQSNSFAQGGSGNVVVSAATTLSISEESFLATSTLGSARGGDVVLNATDVIIDQRSIIATAASGSADAGRVAIVGEEIALNNGFVETSSENGGGGDITLLAEQISLFNQTGLTASSSSSDSSGNGGSITIGTAQQAAALVLVERSLLSASADAGNGGQISINADTFLRDASSVFLVTSVSGDPGQFAINAPEQDISAAVNDLEVPVLDASNLITDECSRIDSSTQKSSLSIPALNGAQESLSGYRSSLLGTVDDKNDAAKVGIGAGNKQQRHSGVTKRLSRTYNMLLFNQPC